MRNQLFSMIAMTALTMFNASGAQAALLQSTYSNASVAVSQTMPYEQLVQGLRANPNDLSLRRSLAQALIKKGLTVKAAEQIRLVMAFGGQNGEDLTTLGDATRYSGDAVGAIKAYKSALTLTPMSVKARTGLSLAYAAAGDLNSAVSVCRSSLNEFVDATARQELINTLASLQQLQASKTVSVASASITQ